MHKGWGCSPVEIAKWKLARPPCEAGLAQAWCRDALGVGMGSAMALDSCGGGLSEHSRRGRRASVESRSRGRDEREASSRGREGGDELGVADGGPRSLCGAATGSYQEVSPGRYTVPLETASKDCRAPACHWCGCRLYGSTNQGR